MLGREGLQVEPLPAVTGLAIPLTIGNLSQLTQQNLP